MFCFSCHYNIKLTLINNEKEKEKAFVNCFKCWKLKKKMIIVNRYSIKPTEA